MTLARTAATLVLAAATAATAATAAGAQQASDQGTFTLVQHGSTIATETFDRSGDTLRAELAIVNQATLVTRAVLRPDGRIARLEVKVFAPGALDGDPIQTSAVTFEEGEASVEQPIGTVVGPPMEVDPGAVPYVNPSPSFMEQILRRARAVGGADVAVPVWVPGPGGGQVSTATVAFRDDDATLDLGGVSIEVTTDAEGRLLFARVPEQGLVIERN